MPKQSLNSYMHSCDFVVDYAIVRTGWDTCEWTSYRGTTGKRLIWMNGILCNVSSAKRMSGTFDEFAAFVKKALRSRFKNDYEYRYIETDVKCFLNDMPITTWKKQGTRSI